MTGRGGRMKKTFFYLMVLVLTLEAAGCASVQKKFTRKKKVPAHIPTAIYMDQGPTQKKYSNEYYYKTHYTMWKSWQDELAIQLGGNSKKVLRCAQEAFNHLTEMSRYLTPEKRAILKEPLESLARILKRLKEQNSTRSEQANWRFELEKIKRMVANNFYYEKVKGDILPDNVDLGGPGASAGQPAP